MQATLPSKGQALSAPVGFRTCEGYCTSAAITCCVHTGPQDLTVTIKLGRAVSQNSHPSERQSQGWRLISLPALKRKLGRSVLVWHTAFGRKNPSKVSVSKLGTRCSNTLHQPAKPTEVSSPEEREKFITAKYEKLAYVVQKTSVIQMALLAAFRRGSLEYASVSLPLPPLHSQRACTSMLTHRQPRSSRQIFNALAGSQCICKFYQHVFLNVTVLEGY